MLNEVFTVTGALAACHYITARQEKIFHILYKALNSTNDELQTAAHDCMKKVRSPGLVFLAVLISVMCMCDFVPADTCQYLCLCVYTRPALRIFRFYSLQNLFSCRLTMHSNQFGACNTHKI